MRVRTHFVASTLLSGGLYTATQSLQLSISCFLSGIFIDIDHLFDFLIFSGENFSVKNMFSWCYGLRWERAMLVFHSYEIFVFFSLIIYYFPNNILIGILLGGGLHLTMDQIGQLSGDNKYKVSPWIYFFTFRIFTGFRKEKLFRENFITMSK